MSRARLSPERTAEVLLSGRLTPADFADGVTVLYYDTAHLDAALDCARGRYQESLLRGWSTWSGADLQGTASRYRGRYATSRDALLDRMAGRDIPYTELRVGRQRRRVVVLGLEPADLARAHPDLIVRDEPRSAKV